MITIDWNTKIINIPKSFLTYIGNNIYTLDTNLFRLALKDIEDSTEGMSFPVTHKHNTTVTLAGVTFARVIEIINGYTINFENDQYSVSLLGSNNNIADVTISNSVSIRTNNSAGLIEVSTSGGSSPSSIAEAVWLHVKALTVFKYLGLR